MPVAHKRDEALLRKWQKIALKEHDANEDKREQGSLCSVEFLELASAYLCLQSAICLVEYNLISANKFSVDFYYDISALYKIFPASILCV